jgi:predicted DCC family thiol-disulfide oxidoreductase YuxK
MTQMKSYFLYDGDCGVCTWGIRFLLRFSKSDDLCFSSLNSEFAHKLLDDLAVVYNQEDEGAIYVRGEAVYHKSTAILQALTDCRWPISMAIIFLHLPEGFRNGFYRAFAKRRLKLSKQFNLKCELPKNVDSKRFL